jgi:hypothetical protein
MVQHKVERMKDSGTLLPLLAGRLWSSFNNSLRFSRKASTIPRGLFGLATNTCLAQEKDPRKQLIGITYGRAYMYLNLKMVP